MNKKKERIILEIDMPVGDAERLMAWLMETWYGGMAVMKRRRRDAGPMSYAQYMTLNVREDLVNNCRPGIDRMVLALSYALNFNLDAGEKKEVPIREDWLSGAVFLFDARKRFGITMYWLVESLRHFGLLYEHALWAAETDTRTDILLKEEKGFGLDCKLNPTGNVLYAIMPEKGESAFEKAVQFYQRNHLLLEECDADTWHLSYLGTHFHISELPVLAQSIVDAHPPPLPVS